MQQIDQQQRPRRSESSTHEELTFSADELTELLQKASHLDSEQITARHPSSLADALQTARDLGIPEEHVLIAAEDLKRAKVQKARRRVALMHHRNHFLRFLMLTLAVSIGIALTGGGIHAGMSVFGAMSIVLLIIGSKWIMATLEHPTDSNAPAPGICRVCGAAAWRPNATFCRQHRVV